MVLADLRGKAYNDPAWNLLLDQLSFANPEQWRRCLFEAGYKTGSLTEIGKPESVERDGPQGLSFSDVSGNNWVKGVCAYPAVPVMGAAVESGADVSAGSNGRAGSAPFRNQRMVCPPA